MEGKVSKGMGRQPELGSSELREAGGGLPDPLQDYDYVTKSNQGTPSFPESGARKAMSLEGHSILSPEGSLSP